ncbi:hypothetical protein [Bowmanella sp. JS7-9]|uniref:Uncharacterized protein n=1 Tax=Pseudobowmanella zhangzhouensis TaxID=1537679 RepID=A0ABW1XMS7_9ALTE|nr:hypothetical protein [Bowmanella sp. JS7-9]TBX26038.1 hypothetical protein TK45_02215 [Bowmanella sp. JS7-9]
MASVIILFLTALTTAALAQDQASLPLDCHPVPNATHSLCLAETQGFADMYNDLLVFVRTEDNRTRFVTNMQSTLVGQTWFWGFSGAGRYAVFATSEEGHATFSVYDSTGLLQNLPDVRSAFNFGDYYLPELLALDDDGNAFFLHLQSKDDVKDMTCLNNTEPLSAQHIDDNACVVKVNLATNKNL